MALNPPAAAAGFIEVVSAVPIHSSLVVALAAALFLTGLLVRAHRLSQQEPKQSALSTWQARRARRRMTRTRAREQRRAPMTSTPVPFRIHWPRTVVALVGLVALLAAAVTAILAGFGVLLWTVPLVSVGVTFVALVGLQVSAAIRRRKRRRSRVEKAFLEAMSPTAYQSSTSSELAVATQSPSAQPSAPQEHNAGAEDQAIFDALTTTSSGMGGPDSLVRLDEDGLSENPERLFAAAQSEPTEQSSTGLFDQSAPLPEQPWEPREVPAPKYLAQERIERAEPEPIRQADQPAPSPETKLKHPAAPATASSADAVDNSPSIDLSEVLKRRRA